MGEHTKHVTYVETSKTNKPLIDNRFALRWIVFRTICLGEVLYRLSVETMQPRHDSQCSVSWSLFSSIAVLFASCYIR